MSGGNEEALQRVFRNGLCEQLKDELAVKDQSNSLDMMISLAIQLDNRMLELR